jgi:hypothetical protein
MASLSNFIRLLVRDIQVHWPANHSGQEQQQARGDALLQLQQLLAGL